MRRTCTTRYRMTRSSARSGGSLQVASSQRVLLCLGPSRPPVPPSPRPLWISTTEVVVGRRAVPYPIVVWHARLVGRYRFARCRWRRHAVERLPSFPGISVVLSLSRAVTPPLVDTEKCLLALVTPCEIEDVKDVGSRSTDGCVSLPSAPEPGSAHRPSPLPRSRTALRWNAWPVSPGTWST